MEEAEKVYKFTSSTECLTLFNGNKPINFLGGKLKTTDPKVAELCRKHRLVREVVESPAVARYEPKSGKPTGGTEILFEGENFTPDTTVFIGGLRAQVTVVNAREMKVITPSHSPKLTQNIVIRTAAGGSIVIENGFTYLDEDQPLASTETWDGEKPRGRGRPSSSPSGS